MTVKSYLKYTIFSGVGNIGTNIIVYLLCSRNYTRQHTLIFILFLQRPYQCVLTIDFNYVEFEVDGSKDYTTNIWQKSFHGLYISHLYYPVRGVIIVNN